MSGLLGLFPAPPPAIATNPLPTAPRTNAERYDLEFESNRLNGRFISRDTAMFDAFESGREAFRQAGVDLENPYAGYWWRPLQILTPGGIGMAQDDLRRRQRLDAWTSAQERLARERPDQAGQFLSVDQIGEQARTRARTAAEQAELVARVGGGAMGGFAGSAAAVFTDPVQIATLPFGAPWRAAGSVGFRILETAISEAVIAGATQAVVETGAAPWRAEAGSPGSVGQNIGLAAAGGAILGGGLRALVEGFGAIAGRAAARPGSVLEQAQDAALAGRAQLQSDLANGAGPERTAAHQRAFDNAGQAVTQGRIATDVEVAPAVSRYRPEDLVAPPTAARLVMSGEEARFNTYTPTGRAVLVEPQIMELDSLIPSHLDDGRLNPAFPHDEGVQPRDRSAAPSQDQVRGIAAQLAPARLGPNAEAGFGAPIVATDNVVESGNGRVLALRTAYNDPELAQQAQAYRLFLEAQGHDLTGFRQPVLVSRRISALTSEERRAFVQEANSRGTLASSAAERALQDAERVRGALPLWRGGEVDAVGNAPFVRRVLEQMPASERGDMLTREGGLSVEGARRINDAMMAAAYGDVLGPLLRRFLETRNDGLRNVANALADVAGDWARMRGAATRGEISASVDATADLGSALNVMDQARRTKLAVRDLLVQTDLDRAPLSDAGAAFLAAMYRDPGMAGPMLGRERIAARLQGYIDEAMKTQGGPSLFGDTARPSDVMAVGVRNADRQAAEAAPAGTAMPDQPALMAMDEAAPAFRFDAAPTAPAQLDPALVKRQQILAASRATEAERAAAPPPAVKSAEVMDAQRIAAQQDIAVPNPPEGQMAVEGAPTIGARDLLDEAEARVAQAGEAAACLFGSAA